MAGIYQEGGIRDRSFSPGKRASLPRYATSGLPEPGRHIVSISPKPVSGQCDKRMLR